MTIHEREISTAAHHPFDYYYRDGLPLRPAPPRFTVNPNWDYTRERLLQPWIKHLDDPHKLPMVQLLRDHQWQGDELMDAFVLEAPSVGNMRARAMFNQALDNGIEAVNSPTDSLVRLFAESIDTPPPWFNEKTWEQGRRLWVDCAFLSKSGMAIQDLMGTFVGTEVSTAVGETGRLVNDPYRRNLETFEFFYEVSKPYSLRRFSTGFKTTARVRLMHAQVRARLKRKWPQERFAHHANPISTSHTAIAGITIGLLPMLIDHTYGRRKTREQLDAVLHYWAYINYVIGVAPRLISLDPIDSLAMVDYAVSNAGGPTYWTEQMAQTADNNIAKSSGRRGALTRAAVPPVLGAIAAYSGDGLVRALTHNTRYQGISLQPWKLLAHNAIRLNVLTRAGADKLPLKRLRMHIGASRGDTMSSLAVRYGKHLAERHRIRTTNYTGHDQTEPQCPMRGPG